MLLRVMLVVTLVAAACGCSSGQKRRDRNGGGSEEPDLAAATTTSSDGGTVVVDSAVALDEATSDLAVAIDLAQSGAAADAASSLVDLASVPADLVAPDLVAADLHLPPWPGTYNCAPSLTVYPDHPLSATCTVEPPAGGAFAKKVELIDSQGRLYATLTKEPGHFDLELGWAKVNAVQTIDNSVNTQRWLSLRVTDTSGAVFVTELQNPLLIRCLNGVAACNGVCGDCPGPAWAACAVPVSSDSCDKLCAKVGRTCSSGCGTTLLRYNEGACDSANFAALTYITRSDHECGLTFGSIGYGSNKGVSCCCQ